MSKIENKDENGSMDGAGEGTGGDPKDDKGLGLGVIFFFGGIPSLFFVRLAAFPQVALF